MTTTHTGVRCSINVLPLATRWRGRFVVIRSGRCQASVPICSSAGALRPTRLVLGFCATTISARDARRRDGDRTARLCHRSTRAAGERLVALCQVLDGVSFYLPLAFPSRPAECEWIRLSVCCRWLSEDSGTERLRAVPWPRRPASDAAADRARLAPGSAHRALARRPEMALLPPRRPREGCRSGVDRRWHGGRCHGSCHDQSGYFIPKLGDEPPPRSPGGSRWRGERRDPRWASRRKVQHRRHRHRPRAGAAPFQDLRGC